MNFVNLYYLFASFILFTGVSFFSLGCYFINYGISIFMDWELMTFNSCVFTMTLLFDWVSLIFMGCVLMISSMVLFYSDFYMSSDLFSVRFLYLLFMFIMSMMLMVVSPNLISILLGWDGLGLVSYCLVIYFQNYSSYNAGMLTVLSNRVGDVSILIGISWLINYGDWSFMFYYFILDYWVFYLFLLGVLAAFTKSAQIPFSSWLPAAMAAPTPVSALVHSSTLVTAGVYLMIRFSNYFINFDCTVFVSFGMITMFMSGLGACFEYDLKKIIALSTLSQLGLMMSILFLGYSTLSYLHLLIHAFFKALMFLCAGLIIHVMNDTQDIRYMGFNFLHMPYVSSCFLVSNLSLCGLPFMSGFYSKDLILEVMSMGSGNLWVYFIYYLSTGLTVCYTVRVCNYCLFSGGFRYVNQSYFESFSMIFIMGFLCVLSIIFGCCLTWLVLSSPLLVILPLSMKVMVLYVLLGGVFIYFLFEMIDYYLGVYYSMYSVSWFLGSMWFMPKLSTDAINGVGFSYSSQLGFMLDYGWGEYLFSLISYIVMDFFFTLLNFLENSSFSLILLSFLFFMGFLLF